MPWWLWWLCWCYIYDSKQKHKELHTSERTIVPRTVIFSISMLNLVQISNWTQPSLHNLSTLEICICPLKWLPSRKDNKIKRRIKEMSWIFFAKSCVEGLGWEKEFVFAKSFPIRRHTTEFVSRLYSVKPSGARPRWWKRKVRGEKEELEFFSEQKSHF